MTQTITITLGDNGPATDATVTLASRDGTYAIREASTNTVVLAATPTVTVPHQGNGVYTIDVSQYVQAGTSYESTINVVWADGSTDYYDRPFTVASAALPSSWYGTLADVQNAGGKKNVITYSNLDGKKNDPDYDRIQVVMTQTTARLTTYLKLNGIGKPDPSSSGFDLLTQAWALWVLATLYRARGDLDVQPEGEGQISSQTWDREARRLLRLYVMQVRGGNIGPQIAIG